MSMDGVSDDGFADRLPQRQWSCHFLASFRARKSNDNPDKVFTVNMLSSNCLNKERDEEHSSL